MNECINTALAPHDIFHTTLINFSGLSPSDPSGNKNFCDSIGSKFGDCKAKASHMGLCPLSHDGGTDKNLTSGSSMQNVLT